MFATFLGLLLLLPQPATAAADGPQTSPVATEEIDAWLDRAVHEAGKVDDPVRRADAYGKAAVLIARLGDVPRYKLTISLSEQALAAAPVKPKQSPVEHAASLATTPILAAMVRDGDVAGAKALADDLARAKKYSRAGSASAIAGAQAHAGDLPGALATANELNEYDRRPVLKQIVEALAAKKQFAEAERVAGMLGEKDLERRDAVRAIAAARARAGQYGAALAMADQSPYSIDKQAVYQYVLDAQLEAGKYDAARATAAQMPLGEKAAWPRKPPEHARESAFAAIGWAQLKRKDIAAARETAATLGRDARAQLEAAIVKAYVEAGDLAAARDLAATIPRDAEGSMRTPPRVDADQALADALARAGDIAEALQVARDLPNPVEILLDIAQRAVAHDKHAQAREIVEDVKRRMIQAERLHDFEFIKSGDQIRLRIAILEKALGDSAPYDAAVAELKRRAAEHADPDVRNQAGMQLLGLYLAVDDFENAKRLAPSLPQRALSWGIGFAAVGAAKAGDVPRAMALAALLSDPEDRAAVLRGLVAKDPDAPATPAEIAARIGSLPSAYDRSLAYLARAEELWLERLRREASGSS